MLVVSMSLVSVWVPRLEDEQNTVRSGATVSGNRLRRLTDRLIPDDAVFLFIFKAWNPRIASYVRASTTQKMGKKTSSGGMKLFGNRLSRLAYNEQDLHNLFRLITWSCPPYGSDYC